MGDFGAGKLAGDVDIFDGAVAGEHAQGGGVGGELVIGVGEVRGTGMGIVQLVHEIELPLHLGFHPDQGRHAAELVVLLA